MDFPHGSDQSLLMQNPSQVTRINVFHDDAAGNRTIVMSTGPRGWSDGLTTKLKPRKFRPRSSVTPQTGLLFGMLYV